MHKLAFFPLGNADTCLVETALGGVLLFDYAATGDPDDPGRSADRSPWGHPRPA